MPSLGYTSTLLSTVWQPVPLDEHDRLKERVAGDLRDRAGRS
jgi:hypothetical protein